MTGPRQVEMAALLNWEVMRPHAKPENPVQFGISHFPFALATALGKGARLRFDMNSFAREIDWQTPQTNSEKENAVFALMPNGQRIAPNKMGKLHFGAAQTSGDMCKV